MNAERRQQVDRLLEAALFRVPEERAAFLAGACCGDEALRHEVETLLSAYDKTGSFMDAPAPEAAAREPVRELARALVGRRVGHFEIVGFVGAGGMAEVYRARDTRLGRDVAIKILPGIQARRAGLLRRFEQEARAAAKLDHPNVCIIHEVGETDDGRHFIAMEYVEGETLRARLEHGGVTLSEALEIAVQIGSALQAAHEVGIIHRDVKPENVMVRPDGMVKVLDFGLAKLAEPRAPGVDTEATTLARIDTDPGVLMGTPAYMSPEQLRGFPLDARTDVWSLGVVLYELVAGRRPFEGPKGDDLIASILRGEPPLLVSVADDVRAELARIVEKALAKDREARYQTAKELAVDLKRLGHRLEVDAEMERPVPPETRGTSKGPATAVEDASSVGYLVGKTTTSWTWLVVSVALAALVGAMIYFFASERSPQRESGSEVRSIAVLPFKALDADEEDPSLGLKLADALIARLGRLRLIAVRSTRAVQAYEGRAVDPIAAGREQRVDAVLDGTFQRAGDRLHVRARLLRTSDGRQLWAGDFNEPDGDPFALQDAIAEATARALVPELSGAERELLARHDTENVAANRLYTEARYYWNKRDFKGLPKSVRLLEQAVRLDPTYARAHAGLADSYITLSDYYLLEPKEAFPKAKQEALKALAIDGALAEAHAALAMIKAEYDWDWAGADQAFRRAIEINPHYATAHQWYAEFLSAMGRHEQALSEIRLAEQLDPLSLIIPSIEALVLNYARDYDGAIAQCHRVIDRDPSFGEVYGYLQHAYEQKGMFREAMDANQRCLTSLGYDTPEAAAIRAAPVAGATDYWRRILELSKPPLGGEIEAAQAWAQLGETDKAIAVLQQACARRGYGVMYVRVDPNLDPLRSDPRFEDLLRRVGLAS